MATPRTPDPAPRPSSPARGPDPLEAELLAPLAALTNYERQRPDRVRWTLETTRRLLAAGPMPARWNGVVGRGATGCRAIQVGGSKGKGTVVHLLEALGCAAGMRTVALTSPHLSTVRERIRVDGAPMDAAGFRSAADRVLARARSLDLAVSFFEATIAAGIQVAVDVQAELLLLEVGLGGRLDATTAVPVDGVVLTTIEKEHTAILGDTIPAIAGEKAGCIRPGTPVWTCATGDALEVFRVQAAELNAPLQGVVAAAGGGVEAAPAVRVTDHGWSFAGARELVPDAQRGLWGGRAGEVHWPDAGSPWRWRAAGLPAAAVPGVGAALAAWRGLFGSVPVPALDGDGVIVLPSAPGRGEVIRPPGGPTLVLDGAHTPGSCAALASDLRLRLPPGLPPGSRPHLITAFHSDKDWRGCLRPLAGLADRATVVPLADGASVATAELQAFLRSEGIPTAESNDPLEPIQPGDQAGWFLVTGSFHLVGEVRRRWAGL